jgi:hypothetical protein
MRLNSPGKDAEIQPIEMFLMKKRSNLERKGSCRLERKKKDWRAAQRKASKESKGLPKISPHHQHPN